MSRRLTALAALAEDLDSSLGTYIAANKWLELQFRGFNALLCPLQAPCESSAGIHAGKMFIRIKSNFV